MDKEERKGIFVFDSDQLKRAFLYSHSGQLAIAFEFPLDVFAMVLADKQEEGRLFFKSRDTLQKEANEMPDAWMGDDKLDKREVQRLLSGSWLFQSKDTGDIIERGVIWFKTYYEGNEVFLFDDLFFEDNIIATYPDGHKQNLSGVPFSEECPLEHLDETGNYDIEDISTWNDVFIDGEGEEHYVHT